ncbi:hypothetical protein FNV43_RR09145 [Rhamnella rubrinervis]|uniref:Protein LITTLE ZIPPER 1-like n=1 Tax=Rhamnella rubrinervis TaxID=2594499 RepID=A0A8K0MJQ6_9ROSA|nr:hypothetical protein FNV43_RR09145 [Rhamnella rubrinervis]
MCISATDKNIPSPLLHYSKRKQRSKIQVHRLTRRRCEEKEGKDLELKNLKLYLENQTIIEENKKLKQRAHLLHQENLALLSEFNKKFPNLDRFSATLFLLLHKN